MTLADVLALGYGVVHFAVAYLAWVVSILPY
jgi:hypothetical protein